MYGNLINGFLFLAFDTSPKRSERLRSKRVAEHEDGGDQSSSGMSLDVLAHVASETLKKEPKSGQKIFHKKVKYLTVVHLSDQ